MLFLFSHRNFGCFDLVCLIVPNTFVIFPIGITVICNIICLWIVDIYAATPGQNPGVAHIYIYIVDILYIYIYIQIHVYIRLFPGICYSIFSVLTMRGFIPKFGLTGSIFSFAQKWIQKLWVADRQSSTLVFSVGIHWCSSISSMVPQVLYSTVLAFQAVHGCSPNPSFEATYGILKLLFFS